MSFYNEYPSLENGALEIDPQDFADAFQLMSRVYSGVEGFSPIQYSIRVENEQGQVENLPVEDTPLNRILVALREWYREESIENYISLCWRLFCLSKLIRDGILDDWIRMEPESETTYISGSIIYTAATLPLNSIEGFDRDQFLQAIFQYDND